MASCRNPNREVWESPRLAGEDVKIVEVMVRDYAKVEPEDTMVRMARGLGICLGD